MCSFVIENSCCLLNPTVKVWASNQNNTPRDNMKLHKAEGNGRDRWEFSAGLSLPVTPFILYYT